MRTRKPKVCEWANCTAERPADAEQEYDGWVWLSSSSGFGGDALCPEHAAALEAMLKPVDELRWTPLEPEE